MSWSQHILLGRVELSSYGSPALTSSHSLIASSFHDWLPQPLQADLVVAEGKSLEHICPASGRLTFGVTLTPYLLHQPRLPKKLCTVWDKSKYAVDLRYRVTNALVVDMHNMRNAKEPANVRTAVRWTLQADLKTHCRLCTFLAQERVKSLEKLFIRPFRGHFESPFLMFRGQWGVLGCFLSWTLRHALMRLLLPIRQCSDNLRSLI